MCPLYVAGLIGPGERKSVGPMAERVAPGHYDRLHHFVSDGVWDAEPLERELSVRADKLVGGANAFLVIDDTALPKKGAHSVGVAPQYASALGKTVESRCGAVVLGRAYLFAAPFVWRCLSGSTMTPFPHPAHRTGRADFPHPALGQDLTPSSTARRAQAGPDVRARSARRGARVDSSRPCVA